MNRRTLIKSLTLFLAWLFLPFRLTVARAGKTTEMPMMSKQAENLPLVLRVISRNATDWDYRNPNYLDAIDYSTVKKMVAEGLTRFTETTNTTAAWRMIIQPYTDDDEIVIKPNINNSKIGYSEAIMTSPQVVSALIESLLEAGYPASRITVYDLTAVENETLLQWIKPLGSHPYKPKGFW